MLSFISGGYQGDTADRRGFLSFLATGWDGGVWGEEGGGQELVMDREACCASVHRVTKS